MKLKFQINIPYWIDKDCDKSTRLRNVRFVARETMHLCYFLRLSGIDIDYQVWDFSPVQTYEGAIHVPGYQLGEFRKSEKWNEIIRRTNADIFVGLDSDVFIHESDYEKFLDLLCEDFQIYLFNAACIHESLVDKIDWSGLDNSHLIDLPKHLYQTPPNVCSFGGLWICPTQVLKDVGMFCEYHKVRGDEDGTILSNIYKTHKDLKIRKVAYEFYPIHLPHEYDFSNPLYAKTQ